MTYVCNDPCWRSECMCWTNPFCISTGPWGAWRAGLAETMDAARHYDALGNSRRILTAINAVCAAGWSP